MEYIFTFETLLNKLKSLILHCSFGAHTCYDEFVKFAVALEFM